MALKFGYEAAVGVAAGPIGAHHHLGHHNQQHLAVFVILEADLTPMAPRVTRYGAPRNSIRKGRV